MKFYQAGLIGVFAAGGLVFAAANRREHPPEVKKLQHQSDQAIESSGRSVGHAVAIQPAARELDPAPVSSVSMPDSAKVADAPEPPRTEEQQMIAVHQHYEAVFANASPDPAWTAAAKRLVDEKLPSLLPDGSSLRQFDCRTSLCRLETAHKDHDSYMRFIERAFLRGGGQLWNAATYSTPLNDNPKDGLMVTYIAREGQSLPE